MDKPFLTSTQYVNVSPPITWLTVQLFIAMVVIITIIALIIKGVNG